MFFFFKMSYFVHFFYYQMLCLTKRLLYAKRELETLLLKRRLRRQDDRNNDLLLRSQLALSKIKACYVRANDRGLLADSALDLKFVQNLLDVQLKPKSLFFHSPHKLHRQFILDRYPRVANEQT